MIAIDLSKQKALDADPKAIQQINFSGNLDLYLYLLTGKGRIRASKGTISAGEGTNRAGQDL